MKKEKPAKREEVRARIRGLVRQALQEALEVKIHYCPVKRIVAEGYHVI